MLPCHASAPGPQQISWAKHRGVLPLHSFSQEVLVLNLHINCFIVVAFLIIQGKLVIPEVQAEDGGFYICNVTSAASEHAASALLNVTGLVPRFGQSPVSYQTFPQLQDAFLNLELSVSFRPEAGAGLILYNGNTDPDTQDFISLGLASSVPELRYNLGSGVTVVRAQRPVR